MPLYERELDHEDAARVTASLLQLRPALTWQEVACLRFLARRSVWEAPFESRFVGTWELEQLDKRYWVEAQEIDLEQAEVKGGVAVYTPRGPWFGPVYQRLTAGRPDWPSIVVAFREAVPHPNPDHWEDRLYARIRLTERGKRAVECLHGLEAFELGLFDEVAYSLERCAASWRERDKVVSRLLAAGFSTAQGGFEKIVRDGVMVGVRSAWASLQEDLVPRLSRVVDPGLRDEIRTLVRGLNPDALVPDPDEGHTTHRWRLDWSQLDLEDRIEEVKALLFAMNEEADHQPEVNAGTPPSEPFRPEENRSLPIDAVEFQLGSWFEVVTKEALTRGNLQRAASRGQLKLSKKGNKGSWLHSVVEVAGIHTEQAGLIQEAVDKLAGTTRP